MLFREVVLLMIYVMPEEGLCNRMRVIASYYIKAKKYKNPLVVLWKKNHLMGCGLYDLFSEIDGVSVIDDLVLIEKIQKEFQQKGRFFFESGKIAGDPEKRKELRINLENIISTGEDICVKTCYDNGVCDWSIFEPNVTVKQRLDDISFLNDDLIGVHIRRKDQLASIRNSPTELFIGAMVNEIRHNNKVRFFLATDEEEEERFLRWYFGDRIISLSGKNNSRSDADGTRDAVVDLYCLSMCKKLYGSFNSSFTGVAHRWNRKKEFVLIDNGRKKSSVGAIYRDGSYEWSYEKSFELVKKYLSFQQLLVYINCMYFPRALFCTNQSIRSSYLDFMKMCQPYSLKNHGFLRIGSENYGGHVICDILEPGCAVSIGNYYGEWNYQMAERRFDVYQYADKIDKPLKFHPNIHFEKITNYNLKEIILKTGTFGKGNAVLQMDVRGLEWEILSAISEKELKCFNQIVIDFHDLLSKEKINYYKDILKVINRTHQVVHIHYNNNVPMMCFNNFIIANVIRLTFVRRDVGEFYPATHVFPTPLDNPTDSRNPEVFIGKFTDILKEESDTQEYIKTDSANDYVFWRDRFLDVSIDTDWIKKRNVCSNCNDVSSSSYNYAYSICCILKEYSPQNILEFNFDSLTKITAQYASSHNASLTVLANNRERVEHFMGCWEINWKNSVVHVSNLINVEKNGKKGVAYQNFNVITKGKKYNLILLKSPLGKGVRIHMDILMSLPELIKDDFAILMDHVEDDCGEMVFKGMMDILEQKGIRFLRKDFPAKNRLVSALFSESWKYIAEF